MQIEHYNDANITLADAFTTKHDGGENKHIQHVEVTVYPSWVKIHGDGDERILSSSNVLLINPTEQNDQPVN